MLTGVVCFSDFLALRAGDRTGREVGMIIYFLRHAEAEDDAGSDFVRKLTAKGLEQAAKVGKFLRSAGIAPELIVTSPVVRARQTADIVANALEVDLSEEQWLACGMSAATCRRELAVHEGKASILLVGHEPDFSEVIADFIGLPDSGALHIRKASLTAVEWVQSGRGAAQLQFLVPARLMSNT